MYILIIFLPLLSFFTLSFAGRFIGKVGSILIALSCMILAVFFSFFIFYEVALSKSICTLKLASWINLGVLNLSWGLLFDSLTAVMLIVVTFISCLVHLYSISYMGSDPHLTRFISYLSLFTFFMLVLVTADNFFQMFLGWEGVGLASYLLINFWYTRLQANKSAIKAIILNRIGDFGLALGVFAIFFLFNSIDFVTVFSLTPIFSENFIIFSILGFNIDLLSLIGLFLFIGTVGKSAQMGLHMWLPDAMEGPTPVSALIHAATMVTAGVFVLLRTSPLISYSSSTLMIITIFGAITALFAATVGVVQNDLKRIIAYSTCSQLGYMVFSSGLLNYSASLFHLTTHAFFKALLFLSAGVIIHSISDDQDIRRMGGLLKLLPYTYIIVLIGSLALMGFPFLAGFYSKDVILEYAFSKGFYIWESEFSFFMGTLAAFLTAFYSFRLLLITFLFKTNLSQSKLMNVREAPFFLGLPLFVLALFSMFIGFFLKDMFIGLGSDFFYNSLFSLPLNNIYLEIEFIPTFIKLFPGIFSILGALLSIFVYSFCNNKIFSIKFNLISKIYYFLLKKWYFDLFINFFVVPCFLNFAYKISFNFFDRGLFEQIGPSGLSKIFFIYSHATIKAQSGYIYHYAFIFVLGLFLFLSLFILKNVYDNFLLFLIVVFLPFSTYLNLRKHYSEWWCVLNGFH